MGNPIVDVRVMLVPVPPVPAELADNNPFKVVVLGDVTVPPH